MASEPEEIIARVRDGMTNFAADMKAQGIHVGFGTPGHCVTCGRLWPCPHAVGDHNDARLLESPEKPRWWRRRRSSTPSEPPVEPADCGVTVLLRCELPLRHKGHPHRFGGTPANKGNGMIEWDVDADGEITSTSMPKDVQGA